MRRVVVVSSLLVACLGASGAAADGSTIGKVYMPYVNALEKELEYQWLLEHQDPATGKTVGHHKLALGGPVAERWFVEGIVNYIDEPSFGPESYELELRHQLTEQGEYGSDWGVMLELEKEDGIDEWELGLGLLNTLEWRRWQMTTNLFLIREWGDDVKDEFDTALAWQLRYRLRAQLEPGLELFMGEDTRALGPMLSGQWRLQGADRLQWQLSLLFGSGNTTADETLKFELEYEFY